MRDSVDTPWYIPVVLSISRYAYEYGYTPGVHLFLFLFNERGAHTKKVKVNAFRIIHICAWLICATCSETYN